MDKSERIKRLKKLALQFGSVSDLGEFKEELQSSFDDDNAIESLGAGKSRESHEALETLSVIMQEGINANVEVYELEALEAIIHESKRPVIDIVNDKMELTQLTRTWQHFGENHIKEQIENAIPSVGRIEVPDDPRGLLYAGTGFVVGEGLLMTNRHVAEIFASGLGVNGLKFRAGQEDSVAIDFARERGSDSGELFRIRKVLMIHPYWDMALLRVDGLTSNQKPLDLSTRNIEEIIGDEKREVAVIGYPAMDRRNNFDLQCRLYRNLFNVKRLQPGILRKRRSIKSFGKSVDAVTHDCTSLGGCSGSTVFDVQSGEVLALHFAGIEMDANFAVPTCDLASDSRVVDQGVSFIGKAEPRGDFYGPAWNIAETAGSDNGQRLRPPDSTFQGTTNGRDGEGMFSSPNPIKLSELASFFSLSSLLVTGFNLTTAMSLSAASKLSYQNKEIVETTTCNDWSLSSCQFIEADDTQCFVASDSNTAIVAFRGTESLGDWISNLNTLSRTKSYGIVHRGFLNAFEIVKNELERVLHTMSVNSILLTGHSLGGALATVAAAEWQGSFPINGVYTYGQPAVGKQKFPSFIRENYNQKFFRFVNDDDVVPRVPPTYKHVGRLFHFNSNGKLRDTTESLEFDSEPDDINMMTEAEFDFLRAQLLERRAQQRANGSSESLESSITEGILPSIRDHSIDTYIRRIAELVE